MTFIETVSPERASGAVAEIYEADRAAFGRLPNFTRAFSHRPGAYAAWEQLSATIRGAMNLRRYELVTIAAAGRLRSSYCMLARGALLADELLDPPTVRAIVADPRSAGLDAADVAVMELAEKVADDATAITQRDIDALRALGLSDEDVVDVVLAAAARCFLRKVLDALGALPDHQFSAMESGLRDALTVGRPIAER